MAINYMKEAVDRLAAWCGMIGWCADVEEHEDGILSMHILDERNRRIVGAPMLYPSVEMSDASPVKLIKFLFGMEPAFMNGILRILKRYGCVVQQRDVAVPQLKINGAELCFPEDAFPLLETVVAFIEQARTPGDFRMKVGLHKLPHTSLICTRDGEVVATSIKLSGHEFYGLLDMVRDVKATYERVPSRWSRIRGWLKRSLKK